MRSVGEAIAQLAAHPPEGVKTIYDTEIIALAKTFREANAAVTKA